MEIEAKFIVPDEPTYRRLRGLRELAGFAIEPGPTVVDRDQYLDTADGLFLAAGYACRLRREGDGYLITLKGMGDAGGAIHHRDEREVRLDAAETDPRRWPDSPARSLAEEIAAGEPLQPLLALRQERAKRTVRDGSREVAEMSVDRVEAAAGEQARDGESYYELEIELKGEGADDDLERLAAPLRDEWGLAPQPRSKFERALEALRVRAGKLSGSQGAGGPRHGEEPPRPPAARPGAAPRDGPAAPRRGFLARVFRALLPGMFARGAQSSTVPTGAATAAPPARAASNEPLRATAAAQQPHSRPRVVDFAAPAGVPSGRAPEQVAASEPGRPDETAATAAAHEDARADDDERFPAGRPDETAATAAEHEDARSDDERFPAGRPGETAAAAAEHEDGRVDDERFPAGRPGETAATAAAHEDARVDDERFPAGREQRVAAAEPARAQPEGNGMDEVTTGGLPEPEEQEPAANLPEPAREDTGQLGWGGRPGDGPPSGGLPLGEPPQDQGASGAGIERDEDRADGEDAPAGEVGPAAEDQAAQAGGRPTRSEDRAAFEEGARLHDGWGEGRAGEHRAQPGGQEEGGPHAEQPGPEDARKKAARPAEEAAAEAQRGSEAPEPSAEEEGGPRAEQPSPEDTQKEAARPTEEAAAEAQRGSEAPEPSAEQPERPPVRAEDPMSEAGRHVMLIHYRKMCENEAGTREGEDDEALHDMRVATRRMRAAYDIFSPYFEEKAIGKFIKGLKKTGRELGAVRDLDVLIKKAKDYQDEHAEREGFSLDPLLDAWKQRRDQARDELLDYLNGGRYEKFKENFGEFLAGEGKGALEIEPGQPTPYRVCDVVPRLVMQRYEAVRAYEPVLEGAPLGTYHQLRIACKKLRYTLEFFKEVLGDPAPKLIKRVTEMQDLLGDQHDSAVAEGLVADFLAEQARQRLSEAGQPSLEGAASYLAAQWSIQRDIMARFPDMWAGLIGYSFRKDLSLAVAAL